MRLLKVFCLASLTFFLTGCGTLLSKQAPENGSLVRLTKYEANIDGTFTNTSARADGCQVVMDGELQPGTAITLNYETCSAYISAED